MNSRTTNLYPKPTPGVTAMEMLSVDSTSVQHTFATTYNRLTRYVVLDVQDADAYVTYTGENASDTVGHRLFAGRSYTWAVETAQQAKFVATGSTTSVIAASEFTD
jgi:hypothetical protein